MDKQIQALKEKLANLKSKPTKKVETKVEVPKIPEVQVQVPTQMPSLAQIEPPVPILAPAPIQTPPPEEYVDLTPQEMGKLQMQLDQMEQKQAQQQVPQEAGVSEEDMERMQQIQAEIDRLQNTGVFRAEVLYQLLGLNTNLERIATSLEKR